MSWSNQVVCYCWDMSRFISAAAWKMDISISDDKLVVSNAHPWKEVAIALVITLVTSYPAIFTTSEFQSEYIAKIIFALVFFCVAVTNIGDSDGMYFLIGSYVTCWIDILASF